MTGSVLITGGAGFIGAATARRLRAAGAQVRVLDDLSTGSRAALPPGVELVVADVRDARALESALDGARLVLHLAGRSGVERCAQDSAESWDVNVRGTTSLLHAAARSPTVRRVVLASSAAVLAEPAEGREGTYARSRRAAEQLAAESALPELLVLRYFNVYGPGQRTQGPDAPVIGRFVRAASEGRALVVQGDGAQRRDFVHVDDVAEANRAALLGELTRGTFEIGTGRSTAISELIRLLSAALGRPLPVEHRPARPGDPRHSAAELGPARAHLGWSPRVDLREGLIELVQASSPVSLGLPCMLP